MWTRLPDAQSSSHNPKISNPRKYSCSNLQSPKIGNTIIVTHLVCLDVYERHQMLTIRITIVASLFKDISYMKNKEHSTTEIWNVAVWPHTLSQVLHNWYLWREEIVLRAKWLMKWLIILNYYCYRYGMEILLFSERILSGCGCLM